MWVILLGCFGKAVWIFICYRVIVSKFLSSFKCFILWKIGLYFGRFKLADKCQFRYVIHQRWKLFGKYLFG